VEKSKKLNLIGLLLLFSATIVWGTSFFILKATISEVPAFYVISVRFLVAAGGLSLIFIKKVKAINKATFFRGVILGLFLTFAYIAQTTGLSNTTPGRNAFLTSSYCVMCPFIIWLLFKKRPKLYNVIAAVLCIVGIGFVALSSDTSGGNLILGDGLTLVGAVFFGLQIIFIDKFQRDGHDPIKLLVPEILTAGVVIGIASLIFELPVRGIGAYALNLDQIMKIGYLTLACTLFAQLAQILGQKFTTANQSSIILSLESVFGVFFSVLFADEKLTTWVIVGFVIIFIAMLISELHLDPIKMFKRKNNLNSTEPSSDENNDITNV